MSSVAVRDLLTDAAREVGIVAQGETLSAPDTSFTLGRLNQILDSWNAIREAVYDETFETFTFIANQQDYTIGPDSADFTVTSRPVSLEGANVILDTVSPSVRNPITLRDYQWWMNLTVRSVSTSFPTDLYYSPGWPNGTLHFWPTPTTPYGLELVIRLVLTAPVTINTTLSLPVGYERALMLTVAEDLVSGFGVPESKVPRLNTKARKAREVIFRNNAFTPRLTTQDAGMPSQDRNRSSFNYRTGLDTNVNR
jgi:hypothetical protein